MTTTTPTPDTSPTIEPQANAKARRIGLIIGSSLLAAVLACGGAYVGLAHIRAQHVAQCQSANAAYSAAVSTLVSSRDQLKKLVDSTTEDAVADKTVLTTAVQLVKNTSPSASLESCDTIGLLDFDTSRFIDRDKDAHRFTTRGEELKKAGKTITASVELKKLNDAKAAANALIEQATSLLASSDNKVADNATRTTLKNTIDALTAVMAKNSVTVDEITSAMKAITDASTAVNTSMEAKTQADQAAAQAQRRNTRNRGSTGGGSSGGGSAGSGTSNFDVNKWLEESRNILPPSRCEIEGTCHLALG